MSDIVERLRDRDAVIMGGLFHAIPAMNEAAVEIERLRAAVAAQGAWQPINDYVPGHDNQSVLVVDRGIVSEAYYNGESDTWWLANTSEHDFDHAEAIYPTLWQPMPTAPSEHPSTGRK